MLSNGKTSWWLPDPAQDPLVDLTVGQLLDQTAARVPDHEAIAITAFADHGFNARLTYAELRAQSDQMAKGLIALGLRPGERVAVWASNIAEWIATEFAVAKAGLTLVTINPTYQADELRYVLEDSGSRALFLLPRIRHFDLASHYRAIRQSLGGQLTAVISLGAAEEGLDHLSRLSELGRSVSTHELRERQAFISATSTAQIQYTSGTTGRPKGAALAHFSLVNNARLTAQRWQLSTTDRWCNPLPLFHTAGCVMATLSCVAAGACQLPIVWFDALRTLDTVEESRATILHAAPTMLIGLLRAFQHHRVDVSSLRLVGAGGAPVPVEIGRNVRSQWGKPLRIVYGLTETSPLITVGSPDLDDEHGISTVGTPLPHTELRIDNLEGQPVELGQPGELRVRGYLVMQGYINNPDATARVVDADGWFRTGDLGTLDEAGFIRIVGRSKDIIIRGGENIYPAEVEQLLCEHPQILEAAVVGVPDPYYGEEACAAIRVEGSVQPDELKAWLGARVSHQKVPRYVVAVDRYPVTDSGKVQKFVLRQDMMRRLGLSPSQP